MSTQELIDGACAGTGPRCAGRHVLAIRDSSEINLQRHAGRVAGLGAVGNGTDVGFFVHPLLAVDADEGTCLGLAHLYLWQRTQGKAPNYKKLPIEAKESIRWIDTVIAGKKRLAEVATITVVADREADLYEWWDRVPDARTHLLIRACRDRNLATASGTTLFDWMDRQAVQGCYRVTLPVTPKRSARSQPCRMVEKACRPRSMVMGSMKNEINHGEHREHGEKQRKYFGFASLRALRVLVVRTFLTFSCLSLPLPRPRRT